MDKNLLLRIIFGGVYALVIIACTTPYGAITINNLLGNYVVGAEQLYFGLITFLLFVGVWECVRMMKFDNTFWKWLVFPAVLLVYYRFSMKYFYNGFYANITLSEILGLSLLPIAALTLFRYPKELYYENGKLIFAVIYTVIPFSFALGLPTFIKGLPESFSMEVFWMFVLIWSSDSFAYIFGRLLGRHKMAPKISPKKTWEGFIGGVLSTMLLGFFIEQNYTELRGNWILVGVLVSVFAPMGDLLESQLKRTFGVKDSGNIIPGHGGILDRLDSFMVCAPVLYLYFAIEKLF
ncbi:phosphatidate cytidylyltransferase [Riemerella anatipestifer]|uniref:phosphatidate cytidylyltransferase n=1 Tax=Riemerella anatipestifer TaxID=34085 RepID=UPI0007EE250A|nr:phosphatidate cytidylyltransferase [Riemerella anatipestifer]MBT0526826.1 phosphatidate cytidylyltransferase [Riemerella anatipestifer]MBT0528811.1 phosphatidate cytidylyltransferase [Riemerella anatipestifer]MBT0530709.1 phosphatidate cytidylyltransferase [Riemerella anatipestifer]MBT0532629.1 phosphatidate cytidylyltransferase [Riemerella anatipestifer]MBT0536591.1 phosphatidate cytidylyltransferase [Riemerella anatipestifer]